MLIRFVYKLPPPEGPRLDNSKEHCTITQRLGVAQPATTTPEIPVAISPTKIPSKKIIMNSIRRGTYQRGAYSHANAQFSLAANRETTPRALIDNTLNRIFIKLISYRSYMLKRTMGTRSSLEAIDITVHIKILDLTVENHVFDGVDPIRLFDFLTRFVNKANTLSTYEVQSS